MKMLEIFYLMIIFNVFMFIFGSFTMSNGEPLNPGLKGAEHGTSDALADISAFTALLGLVLGGLGAAYAYTAIPGVGTAKTPLAYVYITFGSLFQVVYMAAFATFWYPLVVRVPMLSVFSILFTFLVESIFVIGFIQMTTGGWGLYK